MPLLSSEEAFNVSDSFLLSLYGADLFTRWKELKEAMQFEKEREYVTWLMDVANYYKHAIEEGAVMIPTDDIRETSVNNNVKSELMEDNETESSNAETEPHCFASEQPKNEGRKFPSLAEKFSKVITKSHIPAHPSHSCGQNLSGYEVNMLPPDTQGQEYCEDENPDISHGEELTNFYGAVMLSSDDEDLDGNTVCNDDGIPESEVNKKLPPVSTYQKKRHACPHCSYKANVAANLRHHIASVHDKRKPYACEYCYRGARRDHLTSHMVYRHGQQSRYLCHGCGRYFVRQQHLHLHQRTCARDPAV